MSVAKAEKLYIQNEIETHSVHRIECWVCGEKDESEDGTKVEFRDYLFRQGWRFIVSDLYQTQGVACPECVKKPDKNR